MKADILTLALDNNVTTTGAIELEQNSKIRSTAFRAKVNHTPEYEDDLLAIGESEKNFSCSLVTSKITQKSSQELEDQLAKLLKSPAIRAVMKAAKTLAAEQKISEADAAKNIVTGIRELDQIWEQILLKEGIEQLCKNAD